VKVVAVASMKGGVGKTSSAVNLAYEASRTGARVLVWDLDPQGAATYLLRVDAGWDGAGAKRLVAAEGELAPHLRATPHPGLHVLPADTTLRFLDRHLGAVEQPRRRLGALLEPLADAYDVVVLDCPPGATLAIESALRATDLLVVPIVPTTLAARTLEQFREVLDGRSWRPEMVAHISMFDRRRQLHRTVQEELLGQPETLPIVVPVSTVVERMGPTRAPVATYAPRTAAARAYRALWDACSDRLWPA
jgi:chromosome partitioning protein